MSFVYPSFLIALLALLIPIIIHLFSFRRFKKVYFTNVKFLKEVKEEKASRSKLKHWLVLLSRLLALAFLVFAFAQPFIPREESQVVKGDKAVSIYVDNSRSMEAISTDASLIEKAKRKARDIVNAYGVSDRFQIVTNDLEGKHQRLLNKEEVLSYIDEIQPSPNVQTLSQVVDRQKQVLNKSESAQKNVFLISDFQKNIVDFESDTLLRYYFIPLQAVAQQNVFIDTAWFESPVRMLNTNNQLVFRLNNTGSANVEKSKLTLKINGQTKAIKDFSLEAKSTRIDTINFSVSEAGWHQAELFIEDYPINYDDSFYLTFEIEERVDVLSINQSKGNPFLNALFDESQYFVLKNQSVNQLNYSEFDKYRLIVLNNVKDISSGLGLELKQYLENGGNVVVFPSSTASIESYNQFLRSVKANTYGSRKDGEKQIDYINTKQEIFQDVFERLPRNLDLPTVQQSYDMTRFSGAGEENILRFRDGNSFLGKYNVKQGKLYLAATALDAKVTNLPSHAIFVPMIYKIALVGGDIKPLAYNIGDDNLVEVSNVNDLPTDNSEAQMKLKGEVGEFIPQQKVLGNRAMLTINNQLKEAGFYKLYKTLSLPLAYYGFNFNRKESVLDYFSASDLKDSYKGDNINFIENDDADFGTTIGEINKGVVLWKWCLIIALAFLLLEILLLRFWKS